jgi:glycogen(starch) synthase
MAVLRYAPMLFLPVSLRLTEGTTIKMHVLMLGWEFPPFITGGLGTACYGLTRAMDRRGVQVTFVVPKSVGGEPAKHVNLLSPQQGGPGQIAAVYHLKRKTGATGHQDDRHSPSDPGQAIPTSQPWSHATFINVPAGFANPYTSSGHPVGQEGTTAHDARPGAASAPDGSASHPAGAPVNAAGEECSPQDAMPTGHQPASGDYDGDIISQVEQYAYFVLSATQHLNFDVIHAHDWMTYPAGMMLARATGKPLVVHIHSTEFDRSGEHINQRIYDIERRGMNSAMRVIAVSQLTKNLVVDRYAVPETRVEVVYNGVDLEPSAVGITGIRSKDKIVLYFGRITHQKGPEYFIRAAKRVLDVMDNVKFVVAGSGDMAKRMIEMAADMGIGHKVLFTGFLRGADIKRVFELADLYVMPSVSEPFGIAPLEAMSHNVPALISKSSGVSEVLTHVLKVDFWDIDDMANKIVAVLRYPPLSQTLQTHGAFEVRGLTWDGAAQRCEQIYSAVHREMVSVAR